MRVLRIFTLLTILFAGAAMAEAPTVSAIRQIVLRIGKPTPEVVCKVQFDSPDGQQDREMPQNNAMNLAETGSPLPLPGRAKDNGDWAKNAKGPLRMSSPALKDASATDAKGSTSLKR